MAEVGAMTDENTADLSRTGKSERPRKWRAQSAGSEKAKVSQSRGQSSAAARSRGRSSAATQAHSDGGPVQIELSKAQVDQVIRAAGKGGTMSMLLSAVKDPKWTLTLDSDDWAYPAQMDDRRLSRSLLSGLLVLSCFPPDGGYLGIAELARTLEMNTSTTHRYVTTLLAVGLLERDPSTRRYRLARS
jgi:IclR helix-turn-helix domain